MTAVTTVRTKDAALLITDCGYFGPDGRMLGVVSKQFFFPQLPAAVAMRGPIELFLTMHQVLLALGASTFADFAANIAQGLESELTKFESILPAGWRDFDLQAAGWSAKGPDSFFVTGSEMYPHLEKFTPIDMGDLVPSPSGGAIVEEFRPYHFDEDCNFAACELVRRQGAYPVQTANGIGRFIGGGVQVTRVSADGITTRYLQ